MSITQTRITLCFYDTPHRYSVPEFSGVLIVFYSFLIWHYIIIWSGVRCVSGNQKPDTNELDKRRSKLIFQTAYDSIFCLQEATRRRLNSL